MTYQEIKKAIESLKTIHNILSNKENNNSSTLEKIDQVLTELKEITSDHIEDSLQNALSKRAGEHNEAEEKVRECYKIILSHLQANCHITQIELLEMKIYLQSYYHSFSPYLDEETLNKLDDLWDDTIIFQNEELIPGHIESTYKLIEKVQIFIDNLSEATKDISLQNPKLKDETNELRIKLQEAIKKTNTNIELYNLTPMILDLVIRHNKGKIDSLYLTHTHDNRNRTGINNEEHDLQTSLCVEFLLRERLDYLTYSLSKMLTDKLNEEDEINEPLFKLVKSRLQQVINKVVEWHTIKENILKYPPNEVPIAIIEESVECMRECLGISYDQAFDVLGNQIEHDGRRLIDLDSPSIREHKDKLIREENSLKTLEQGFLRDINRRNLFTETNSDNATTTIEIEIKNISVLGRKLIDESSYSRVRYESLVRKVAEDAKRTPKNETEQKTFDERKKTLRELKYKKIQHETIRALVEDTLVELNKIYRIAEASNWTELQKYEVFKPLISNAYLNMVEGFRCLYPKELQNTTSSEILNKMANGLDPVTHTEIDNISQNTSIFRTIITLSEIHEVIDNDPNITPSQIQQHLRKYLPDSMKEKYPGREIPLNNQAITYLRSLNTRMFNDQYLTDALRKLIRIKEQSGLALRFATIMNHLRKSIKGRHQANSAEQKTTSTIEDRKRGAKGAERSEEPPRISSRTPSPYRGRKMGGL